MAGSADAEGGALRGVGAAAAPLVGLALLAVDTVAGRAMYHVPPSRFSVGAWSTVVYSGAADGWTEHQAIQVTTLAERPAAAVLTEEPVRLWPGDVWASDVSWGALVPAAAGLLCLIGVVAVVAALAGDPPDELGAR